MPNNIRNCTSLNELILKFSKTAAIPSWNGKVFAFKIIQGWKLIVK